MDRTIRSGCAARSVIAVSMLRGPPLITGVRRPRDGTTRPVRMSRLIAILAVLMGALTLAACGDGAQDAVDRARSEARSALDESGLREDLDRAQARVDALVNDGEEATGVRLDQARARAERAIRDARARVEKEVREARREGATQEELGELRRQARERLDDLGDRVDEAFGP
jgi:hypothetical protein